MKLLPFVIIGCLLAGCAPTYKVTKGCTKWVGSGATFTCTTWLSDGTCFSGTNSANVHCAETGTFLVPQY